MNAINKPWRWFGQFSGPNIWEKISNCCLLHLQNKEPKRHILFTIARLGVVIASALPFKHLALCIEGRAFF